LYNRAWTMLFSACGVTTSLGKRRWPCASMVQSTGSASVLAKNCSLCATAHAAYRSSASAVALA